MKMMNTHSAYPLSDINRDHVISIKDYQINSTDGLIYI